MNRAILSGVVLLMSGTIGLGADSEKESLPPLEAACGRQQFETTVREAYEALPGNLLRLLGEKEVTLQVVDYLECPPDCDDRGRLAGRFDPEKPKIVIARRVCREVDGERRRVTDSELIFELDRQVGHAWDWLLGDASGSESFRHALRSDGRNMPAKWAEEFAHYLQSEQGRAEAFARAVAIHLQSLRPPATGDGPTEDERPFRTHFPRVLAHVGQRLARELGLVSAISRPPARLPPRTTGFAVLHLDVPSGAIVTINEQRTQNRSRSRYRHFHITGLDSTRRPVRITVTTGEDSCECPEHSSDASTADPATCCKTIHLRAGDVVHLCFLPPAEPKTEVPDRPPLTPPRIIIRTVAKELLPDPPKPKPKRPTAAFDFLWSGYTDAPVLCTLETETRRNAPPVVVGVSFAPSDIQLKANTAVDFTSAPSHEGWLIGKLEFPKLSLSSGSIGLPNVQFQLDEEAKKADFSLTKKTGDASDGLYEALRDAFVKHLKSNIFAQLERDGDRYVDVKLSGTILLPGKTFPIDRPLRISVRMNQLDPRQPPASDADHPARKESTETPVSDPTDQPSPPLEDTNDEDGSNEEPATDDSTSEDSSPTDASDDSHD